VAPRDVHDEAQMRIHEPARGVLVAGARALGEGTLLGHAQTRLAARRPMGARGRDKASPWRVKGHSAPRRRHPPDGVGASIAQDAGKASAATPLRPIAEAASRPEPPGVIVKHSEERPMAKSAGKKRPEAPKSSGPARPSDPVERILAA